ncbi:MAG TPA: DUF4236 domain-containing protein [Terriglobales bacterium]|nr:DUF4236 domain-containing protein [Terriglobales bacterium]
MGFFFRKRVGLGPLALNLSKSGIGLSAGLRGLRAGLSSHGRIYTSANIPGTGLYYRRYYQHHHAAEPSSFRAGFRIGVLLVPFFIVALIVWTASK